MRYFLAIFVPPVAMLLCGKPFQALFNFVCWISLFGTFPAMLWALLTVSNFYADRRHRELVGAIEQGQAAAAVHARQSLAAQRAALGEVARAGRLSAPAARPEDAFAPDRPRTLRAPDQVDDEEPRRGLDPGQLLAQARASLAGAWGAARSGYAELPEWGQPIVWGLMAATPLSLAFVAYQLAG